MSVEVILILAKVDKEIAAKIISKGFFIVFYFFSAANLKFLSVVANSIMVYLVYNFIGREKAFLLNLNDAKNSNIQRS
tara:strand:+ start:8463 stop:8696 length:234 start_codon:yes stop_codon:yes gene_type:complete